MNALCLQLKEGFIIMSTKVKVILNEDVYSYVSVFETRSHAFVELLRAYNPYIISHYINKPKNLNQMIECLNDMFEDKSFEVKITKKWYNTEGNTLSWKRV